MGAFEVYFMGVRIYSKKQCNIWPNIPMVAEKCIKAHADFIAGEDISVYETFAGLKRDDISDMFSATVRRVQSLQQHDHPDEVDVKCDDE